jgi:wyosine [tRNA(Phe)-imidazoG37] synthetase (radical SAM superfamily)
MALLLQVLIIAIIDRGFYNGPMISFGPIPSRRLGKSLGINNIFSPKTCSFDCVYCQVGRTLKKAALRASFYEPEFIFNNVCLHLQSITLENKPDYLTFVSNGEPTLDMHLGKSIQLLKNIGIPVAVITNASLLAEKSVQADLAFADLVSVKIDSATESIWKKINRPDHALNFKKHIESLHDFSDFYKGELLTESMFIEGLNDEMNDVSRLAELIQEINPSKAYLSVPTRPPAEKWVKPPDPEKLSIIWQHFNSLGINTEYLTGFEGTNTGWTGNIYDDILNITAVHPLREDTLNNLLMRNNADHQVIESLIKQRLIRQAVFGGKKYFLREYHINYQRINYDSF